MPTSLSLLKKDLGSQGSAEGWTGRESRNELAETSTRRLSRSRDGSNGSLSFLPAHLALGLTGGSPFVEDFKLDSFALDHPSEAPVVSVDV